MELTRQQFNRQDLVDNSIFNLLQELNPTSRSIDWNIQYISEIRIEVENIFTEKLKLCDEMTLYPFLKEED